MLNGPIIVGIGCFAERTTLVRVFRKAIEDYILGKFDAHGTAADQISNRDNATQFFRSVIQTGKKRPDQIDQASEFLFATAKITGFYLGLDKHALHLIVFFQNAGHRRIRFSTRLEKFTRLRNRRLH